MLDLSVEPLKILMYLWEDLPKEGSKSTFLISICLRNKGFKVHIQENKKAAHRFQKIIIIVIIFTIINLVFVEDEMIPVPRKLIKFNF